MSRGTHSGGGEREKEESWWMGDGDEAMRGWKFWGEMGGGAERCWEVVVVVMKWMDDDVQAIPSRLLFVFCYCQCSE
jgi:hypothetical protein